MWRGKWKIELTSTPFSRISQSSPAWRAAMAVASPAGPAPTTSSSRSSSLMPHLSGEPDPRVYVDYEPVGSYCESSDVRPAPPSGVMLGATTTSGSSDSLKHDILLH